ncbi:MAG: hypothetical protein IJK89_01015 [Clostridia bacterium]|nr:hypothetical protein [Clostridia bacterium]
MKQLFALFAAVAMVVVLFTGCDKKDGAVTTTTLAGRYDAAPTTEPTTESLKDKLDDAMETVSEKASDAMETVSEKLSEAGSTIREGITDLSEAMTGDGASRP